MNPMPNVADSNLYRWNLTEVVICAWIGFVCEETSISAKFSFHLNLHQWPEDSHLKDPVMQKMFPFDDVIMRSYPVDSYIIRL